MTMVSDHGRVDMSSDRQLVSSLGSNLVSSLGSGLVSSLASSGGVTTDEAAAAKPSALTEDYGEVRTIPAGEFKAKCLKLLDEVAETREPLVITKFGKPVARLVPIVPVAQPHEGLRGALRGSVLWEGDIISPIDVEWDAMK